MAYTPGGGFPDLPTLRGWIGVPATSYDDDRLGVAAGAAQDQVNGNYEWPDTGSLPDGLTDVFVRLVGRTVASDGVRLGVLAADAEFGTVRLSPRDPEVTRQGGMYRKRVFA